MLRNSFRIIDADAHVMDYWSLYPAYIEPKYRGWAEAVYFRSLEVPMTVLGKEFEAGVAWQKPVPLHEGPIGPGEPLGSNGRISSIHPKARPRGGQDSHDTVQDLEKLGIELAVCFQTRANIICAIPDPAFEAAMVRAYNDWMADYCGAYPKRLKGAAILPQRDMNETLKELKRVAAQDWCVAVGTFGHLPGKQPDDPYWLPMYEEMQKHDLPLCTHAAARVAYPYAPAAQEFEHNRWLAHVTAHPWQQQRATAALVGGGIYDSFPKLKFGYMESGCGWVPAWTERLDRDYEQPSLKSHISGCKERPSAHLKGPRSFYGIDPTETLVPFAARYLGAERLLWASDYPHFDCQWDTVLTAVTQNEGLSDSDKRKILGENALRFYTRIGL